MEQLPPEIINKPVLIVDDAGSMRALLSATLKSYGFKYVFEATDGSEAYRLLQLKPIGLIFCDWEMPNKDGLQLFKDLKQEEKLKNIPFVLVTSMAELDKVKVAINEGVKDYIVKPFKEGTLLSKINGIFASSVSSG
ncbi:MAG: response regulator [Gammaproteobacteria bacterium]|nr:response regulator [Gammaproteobacteria bacterium]